MPLQTAIPSRRHILSISSDIGISLARAWLAEGCEVSGTYRTMSPQVEELQALGARVAHCDLADRTSVDSAMATLTDLGSWDVLVVAPGAQEPVCAFEKVDIDAWSESIDVNFTAQLRAVHRLLPFRRTDSALGPVVLLFAGGGTNNATLNYSAYTIAKIASIKMCELLDAEVPDTRFTILGPGWVKTKIHEATLKAPEMAGANYQRTVDMLNSGNCVPMEKVVEGCNWLVNAPRDVIGGRNFSLVHDQWGTEALNEMLRADGNMYKLRRAGNDKMLGALSPRDVSAADVLSNLLETLPRMTSRHVPGTPEYNQLKVSARLAAQRVFGPGCANTATFGPYGTLRLTYHKMGAIDSVDLFGLDELIIFSYYWRNRNRYRRVADVGANIGLHSILLARCGYEVRSYEPDPQHCTNIRQNLECNGESAKVNLIEAAVSSQPGRAQFLRLLGNTTGSHLAGAKQNPYGEIDRFDVELRPIDEIMTWADFVKIDAEGHECQILTATTAAHWDGTDAMVEIGGRENAEKVFAHLSKLGVNMFPQRLAWGRARSAEDLPNSYHDGSLFISRRDEMSW